MRTESRLPNTLRIGRLGAVHQIAQIGVDVGTAASQQIGLVDRDQAALRRHVDQVFVEKVEVGWDIAWPA